MDAPEVLKARLEKPGLVEGDPDYGKESNKMIFNVPSKPNHCDSMNYF